MGMAGNKTPEQPNLNANTFHPRINQHSMWDTTGMTNLTTLRLPRLAVVPYAVAEWLSKKGQTPNELRVWLEKMMRTDVNYIKEDWDLFFAFSIAAAQMDPNVKKISVLAM